MEYADEAKACLWQPQSFGHRAINTGAKEFVRGLKQANSIARSLATFMRVLAGTFRNVGPKYSGCDVGEFVDRHCIRNRGTLDLTGHCEFGMPGMHLRCCNLVAFNGLLSGARS